MKQSMPKPGEVWILKVHGIQYKADIILRSRTGLWYLDIHDTEVSFKESDITFIRKAGFINLLRYWYAKNR